VRVVTAARENFRERTDPLVPTHEIASALLPALAGSGFFLEEVTVSPAGRRRVVKVILDRDFDAAGDVAEPVPGLTLDEISEATRLVSAVLDDESALGDEPYTLEVTTPGLSRPLTAPRHFQRNVGRLVTLRRRDTPPVTGRIVRAGTSDLTLDIAAVRKEPARREEHAYAGIDRAEVQVEFSHPQTTTPTTPAEEH
jgi:ribosome maturation factor RimP